MKKLIISLSVVLLLLAANCISAAAETCFAVYPNDKAYYGANVDYNDIGIRFEILKYQDRKIFSVRFAGGVSYVKGVTNYPTIYMNDRGLFSSCQIEKPDQSVYLVDQTAKKLEISDFAFKAVEQYSDVKNALQELEGKTLISSNIFMHNLIADKTGIAAIVEAGEKNKTTSIENALIVMTESPASDLRVKNYKDVKGEGADRYITAYDYLLENKQTFTVDKGFEVLKNTAQQWKGGGTLCSLVFDADNNEVYIVLNRDWSRIWKASIKDGTVETWKGFDVKRKFDIGNGITADELLHPKSFWQKHGYELAGAIIIPAGIIILVLARRRKVKNYKKKSLEW